VTIEARIKRLIDEGPLVEADLRHHPVSRAGLKDEFALWGEEPSVRVMLLVDTGAKTSLIDKQLAESLKIEPVGGIDIETASGVEKDCPVYPVELHLKLPSGIVVLSTGVSGLPAGRIISRPGSSRFQGLLGRNALQRSRFMYDGAAGTFDIEVVK
jgi:hypothetical protein